MGRPLEDAPEVMTIRKAHGRAKQLGARVVVETLPLDEQPAGCPSQPVAESPADRGDRGRFGAGNSLAARGGKMRALKARWKTVIAEELGVNDVPTELYDSVRQWCDTQLDWLASTVGGGRVGPDAGALVMAAGRVWGAHLHVQRQAVKTGEVKLYSQSATLADKAKALILTARDLCATAAEAVADAELDEDY